MQLIWELDWQQPYLIPPDIFSVLHGAVRLWSSDKYQVVD